jgi:hypothetical protein
MRPRIAADLCLAHAAVATWLAGRGGLARQAHLATERHRAEEAR